MERKKVQQRRNKYIPKSSLSFESSVNQSVSEASSSQTIATDVSSFSKYKKKKGKKWHRFLTNPFRKNKKIKKPRRYLSSISSISDIDEEVIGVLNTKPSFSKLSISSNNSNSCQNLSKSTNNTLKNKKYKSNIKGNNLLNQLEAKIIADDKQKYDMSSKELHILVKSAKPSPLHLNNDEFLDVPYPKPRTERKSVFTNNQNVVTSSPKQKTLPRKYVIPQASTQPLNKVSSVNLITTPSPAKKEIKANTPTPKPRSRGPKQNTANKTKNSTTSTNSTVTEQQPPSNAGKPHYLVVEVVYHGRSLDGGEKGLIQKKVAKLVDEMLQKQTGTDQIKAVNKEMESASPKLHSPNKHPGKMHHSGHQPTPLNQRHLQQPQPHYIKQQQHKQLHGNEFNTSETRTAPLRQHLSPKVRTMKLTPMQRSYVKKKNHHMEAVPIQFHPNNPVMTPLVEGQQNMTDLTQDDLQERNFFHHQGFNFHLPPHPNPIIEKDYDQRKFQGLYHGESPSEETPLDPRRQLNFGGEDSSLQKLMDFMNAEGRSPSHTSNPRKYQRKSTTHPRVHKQSLKSTQRRTHSPRNSPKIKETQISPQHAAPMTGSPKSFEDFGAFQSNHPPNIFPPPSVKEKSPSRKSPLSLFTRRKGPSPSGTSPSFDSMNKGTCVKVYNESEVNQSRINFELSASNTQSSMRAINHVMSDHELSHMTLNNRKIVHSNENLLPSSSKPNYETQQQFVTPVMTSRRFRDCARTPATPTEHDAWWMPNTWARERAIGAYGKGWKFDEDLERERERELVLAKEANVEKIRTCNFIRF